MRSVKFRAKALLLDDWLYGHYIQEPTYNGPDHKPTEPRHWIREFNVGQLIVSENYVRENTLGQYTGHNDKNGIPIYEGDIISDTIFYSDHKKLIDNPDKDSMKYLLDSNTVVWDNWNSKFGIGIHEDEDSEPMNEHISNTILHIVGNIHDGINEYTN